VTVLSKPSNQTCTVSSGTGKISGADVTNVVVNCINKQAWIHPSGLADNISPDGQMAYSPQVAMDYNGNAIIVWHQSDGSGDQIFKSEYRGGAWNHPTFLTNSISPDGLNAADSQVAMDNNGNAVIVWSQSDGSKKQIYKSEYRGGVWNHPTFLTNSISPDGQNASGPQVAMDYNGNAVIVWSQWDGSKWQIYKSEYRESAWNHPTFLTNSISPVGQHAESPQVAMDNNGNAIIVWRQSDGSDNQTFKSEYRGGAWNHPTFLTNSISPDGQGVWMLPQVAMDDNSNAVIIWLQHDGTTECGGVACQQVYKSEYRGGAWNHPTFLTNSISPDGQDAEWKPQVAMDNNGNSVIVWQQSDGSGDQIFKSEYRGGAWNHPTFITNSISPDGQHADSPQVAMDDNGNAIITWHQYDESSDCSGSFCQQIYKSEYRGGAWIHPSGLADNISPDGQNAGMEPQVAMDDSGNAIIVWRQSDNSNSQIYKSEFR
jgi:hypothetical protein